MGQTLAEAAVKGRRGKDTQGRLPGGKGGFETNLEGGDGIGTGERSILRVSQKGQLSLDTHRRGGGQCSALLTSAGHRPPAEIRTN